MVCNKCGKKVTSGIKFCPECGSEIKEEKKDTKKTTKKEEKVETKVVDEESGYFAWGILGFFVPIVGLILFLVWMNSKKKSSKAAGIGALIGFFVKILLILTSLAGFFRIIFGLIPDDPINPVIPPVVEDKDFWDEDEEEKEEDKQIEAKTINLNDINTDIRLKEKDFKPSKMSELANGEDDHKDIGIITIRNYNQFVIKDDYSGEILLSYNNVKNVYYTSTDCSSIDNILVITNDKVYYINARVHNLSDLSAREINGNYVDYYYVHNHSYTCGGSFIILGKDKNGAYYDLNGETEISLKDIYYYDSSNNYINVIRGYKLAGKYGTVRLIIKSSETDIVEGIIDVNNMAYTYGYDNGGAEETSKLELINSNPVKEVSYSEKDKIVIITFVNDEQYSFEYAEVEY